MDTKTKLLFCYTLFLFSLFNADSNKFNIKNVVRSNNINFYRLVEEIYFIDEEATYTASININKYYTAENTFVSTQNINKVYSEYEGFITSKDTDSITIQTNSKQVIISGMKTINLKLYDVIKYNDLIGECKSTINGYTYETKFN